MQVVVASDVLGGDWLLQGLDACNYRLLDVANALAAYRLHTSKFAG